MNGIAYAFNHAGLWGRWVVVVVPEGTAYEEAQRQFSAQTPEGASFSGRTAVAGKGKVSLAKVSSPVFVPDGEKFSVLFLGWGGHGVKDEAPGMAAWRTKAVETLSLAV